MRHLMLRLIGCLYVLLSKDYILLIREEPKSPIKDLSLMPDRILKVDTLVRVEDECYKELASVLKATPSAILPRIQLNQQN